MNRITLEKEDAKRLMQLAEIAIRLLSGDAVDFVGKNPSGRNEKIGGVTRFEIESTIRNLDAAMYRAIRDV